MIRRLRLPWSRPLSRPAGDRPVRLLAVSDQVEAALDAEHNRDQIAPIDGILGCGDLEPDYLAFLADAFSVPLLYVRGNHDRGAAWEAGYRWTPQPLRGTSQEIAGVRVGGLSWPGQERGRAVRDERAAWWQAASFFARSRLSGAPDIVLSHVPPRGLGDTPEDHYHRGFAGYHWLCRRLRPRLWLHGHTSMATQSSWHMKWGSTSLVNVTGAVLIELERGVAA